MHRCPRCGYEESKGKKRWVRIWASEELEKEWISFSKDYETSGMALQELLRKAKLYDKLQERSRIAVEPPSKP